MAGRDSTCMTPGCEGAVVARRLCGKHYERARRAGTLPAKTRLRVTGNCHAGGCDRESWSRGLCGMHYQRLRVTGTTLAREVPRGADASGWVGDDAAYRTVHSRLVAERGPADGYQCVDCGGAASEWSYDHSDPNARLDERCGEFSVDLDRYEPRCRRCHFWFDEHVWISGGHRQTG